jgi:FMN phosphatase YigB (HAD superfamily)
MVLLFDAAGTLIYKPKFYAAFSEVLDKHGYKIDKNKFKYIHKLLSETFDFPDKTSKEFYSKFNSELLFALGIIPKDILLNDLFNACSYLPWEKYEDTTFLTNLPIKKAVLSNFHEGLNSILNKHFSNEFSEICISENEKLRKPDINFFYRAIEKLSIDPSKIIYVGDSVKLDLEPGLIVGMNSWLIDRNDYYPYCNRRLTSLKEIENII